MAMQNRQVRITTLAAWQVLRESGSYIEAFPECVNIVQVLDLANAQPGDAVLIEVLDKED